MHALLLVSLLTLSLQELEEGLSAAEREFGRVCSFLQDVDGDGTQDLLVGNRTEIYVVSWSKKRILFRLPMHGGTPMSRRARPIPDLSGDSFPDILMETARDGANGTDDPSLTIHDGRTGEVFRTFERMGFRDVGDLEGDGDVEFLVGAERGEHSEIAGGWIGVLDVGSGEFVHRWTGSLDAAIGSSACITGDIDDDGVADIVYVRVDGPDVHVRHGPRPVCFLVFRSGRTGEELRTTQLPWSYYAAINGSRDLDGDGFNELIVTVTGDHDGILVYSARTGEIVHDLVEQPEDRGGWGSGFGGSTMFVDDLDGDGVADVAIEMRDYGLGDGALGLHSGKTGRRLFRIEAPGDHEHFGTPCGTADVNGDGKPDLLVLAYSWETVSPARLYLIDGARREVLWALDWKTVNSWLAK